MIETASQGFALPENFNFVSKSDEPNFGDMLAVAWAQGVGLVQSESKAVRCFEKAAAKGCVPPSLDEILE